MRGPADTPAQAPRSTGVRIALTGAGLSLMLAMVIPVALLSHPAHGVVLPDTAGTSMRPVPAPEQDGKSAQDGQNDVSELSKAEPRGHTLSRAQAVALVQRRYHARVVRTQLVRDSNGRPMYEFRLLSAGGKVWTVRIDAVSGAELP